MTKKAAHPPPERNEGRKDRVVSDKDAEIVLQSERPEPEVDILVASVEDALATIVAAGRRFVTPPSAALVILDKGKGMLVTDTNGNAIGNAALLRD